MTTYVPFAPSAVQAFSFQATLDGQQYNVVITWNLFGQRWYVNVYALDGTLIVARAMTGSATGVQLAGLTWSNGEVEATTQEPHGYAVGQSIALTVSGAVPSGYNGLFQCLITGPSTFSYPLASYPGAATAFGAVSYDVNLVGGVPNENGNYFASTLVFRQDSNQFEISP